MPEPIVVPPEDDRYVMVGDSRYTCTVDEWVATQLDPGERVWCYQADHFRLFHKGEDRSREFLGVVRGTWFYDGVTLDVWDLTDIDNPEKVHLHPGMYGNPDRIWPARGVVMASRELQPTSKEKRT